MIIEGFLNFLPFAHFPEVVFMHFNEFENVFMYFLRRFCDFLCIVFWFLVMFGFDKPYIAALTVVCAVIHEVGHELCFLRFCGRFRMPAGRINGLKFRAGKLLSYTEEILTYASGPLANLVAAAAALFASLFVGEYALTFAVLNTVTAMSNLLPIKGQDGYGIASKIIMAKELDDRLGRALEALSLICSALLCFFSLYLLREVGEGIWIFGVFYISLLSSLNCAGDNVL